MKIIKVLAIAFILISLSNNSFSQTVKRWTLKSNTDGIKIFTGTTDQSKIKAIRVECEFHSTLSQLVSVLMDVKNSEEWLYHTSSNRILKEVLPSEVYYYSKIERPWPVSDRDFIAHLKATQQPITKIVTIEAPCIPDMVPVLPGIVRISNSYGKWVISPSGNEQVSIIYTLHADPGGNIPSWITNLFITQGPSQSFKKLREHLKQPQYKNVKLSYIQD